MTKLARKLHSEYSLMRHTAVASFGYQRWGIAASILAGSRYVRARHVTSGSRY